MSSLYPTPFRLHFALARSALIFTSSAVSRESRSRKSPRGVPSYLGEKGLD